MYAVEWRAGIRSASYRAITPRIRVPFVFSTFLTSKRSTAFHALALVGYSCFVPICQVLHGMCGASDNPTSMLCWSRHPLALPKEGGK